VNHPAAWCDKPGADKRAPTSSKIAKILMTQETDSRPRVGVPWRTVAEESGNKRERIENYLRAVREAGGEPIVVSLRLPEKQLQTLAQSLDAVLLTGSPADIEAQRWGSARHPAAGAPDPDRERTDDALLDHAFATGKPVLAICYGAQLLNVHFGGSLIQDIPSEMQTTIDHDQDEDGNDGLHAVRIEGGHLAEVAGQLRGTKDTQINSSHHQSILQLGRGLRVTARAADDVVEAVEWEGNNNWVVGVQWHPERMRGDALAHALFRRLISEARAKSSSAKDRPATP
jgi:putative glutamine amidotransferase